MHDEFEIALSQITSPTFLNLEGYNEEQSERFYQNIKGMESRYHGRWDEHKMADFCWMLKR